jgi:Popeye-like protein
VVEACLHVANIFYLASFLGRDMLVLRSLTCAGLSLGILFFSCQTTPMYGPTAWHLVFLGINCVQIRRIVLERRDLKLTEEQAKVAATTFAAMTQEELVTLLTHVMHRGPVLPRDLVKVCHEKLTPEERALRDIAIRRLSRDEITNLLTRKLWTFLKKLNPVRWRGQRNARLAATLDGPSKTAAAG